MRWDSVSGATGYQVWFPEIEKVISAYTNVADLREFYTLHSWYSTVQWRVRAVRRVFGTVPNGLPVVSYGPWSPTYTASNPAPATGKLQTTLAISDEISDGKKQSAHGAHAGPRLLGRHGHERAVVRPLPRLCIDGHRLRQHRVPSGRTTGARSSDS